MLSRTLLLLFATACSVSPLLAMESCQECHESEVAQWEKSNHAVAMAEATTGNIKGDFSGEHYRSDELRVEFDEQDGRPVIRMVNESGVMVSYPVAYTFGSYPLQQYLLETENGRLQAFDIAWDARPEKDGGQRWFQLGQSSADHPGDPFHWTGIYQNWNSQCADCHSTGLTRNYSPESDSYSTTSDHISVGCSACHQDAEAHAQQQRSGESLGAGVELSAMGAWLLGRKGKPPRHVGETSSPDQVPTCGKCHSLRTRLNDDSSRSVHDDYRLSLLHEPLYFPDGQVREEVFVMGSFEQSRMFQKGVVCSNCHNPHSNELVAEGNAVCTQCHAAADFETEAHHHHPPASSGAQCVNCHMPERTFMKIDKRRDHSFMVPRPDIAKESGSPDVCLGCHSDKTPDWSEATVQEWAPDITRRPHWFRQQQGNLTDIAGFIRNQNEPAIRRATLLSRHSTDIARNYPEVVLEQMALDNPLLRAVAAEVAREGGARLIAAVRDLLDDSALSVRLAAIETLILSGHTGDLPEEVWVEYEEYLAMQSDLPAGRANRARFFLATDRVYNAEKDLRNALEKDPGYAPAALLLTNILRSGGRAREAVDVIDGVLRSDPDQAQLIHVRGLSWIGIGDSDKALNDLKRAAELAPGEWLYGYRYAVALYRFGNVPEARKVTQQLITRFPGIPEIQVLNRDIQ